MEFRERSYMHHKAYKVCCNIKSANLYYDSINKGFHTDIAGGSYYRSADKAVIFFCSYRTRCTCEQAGQCNYHAM